MQNILLRDPQYTIDETASVTRRRFMYPDGHLFSEYTSRFRLFGVPLVHFTRGRCPETGRLVVAKGIIAVGRVAVGVVAVGQAALGIIAIGQAALGALFAVGQACFGTVALGQLAVGYLFGLGQLAVGKIAIGQFAIGDMALGQAGFGKHVWSVGRADPAAVEFFKDLFRPLL